MADYSPKINLLYYKNILDLSFKMFFDEYNYCFVKDGDSYVMSKSITYSSLKKIFRKYITDEISKYISEYSISSPNYYFIIGSCHPSKNIVLKYKDSFSDYISEKLLKHINSGKCLKYVMKEKDIKINIELFNDVFDDIFNEFLNPSKLSKHLTNNNLFFIKNEVLDCYFTFKLIKKYFGGSNVVNLYKEHNMDNNICIYSINECIDRYINKKYAFINSDILNFEMNELCQYMTVCMANCK